MQMSDNNNTRPITVFIYPSLTVTALQLFLKLKRASEASSKHALTFFKRYKALQCCSSSKSSSAENSPVVYTTYENQSVVVEETFRPQFSSDIETVPSSADAKSSANKRTTDKSKRSSVPKRLSRIWKSVKVLFSGEEASSS